ncbi:MAG: TRAP transporter substrate-binding protein [Desulfitobacteriaceae bacterium]
MGKRFIMIVIGLFLLTLSGCGSRVTDGQQIAKGERIVIKFSHVVAENTPKGLAAARFADLVRQRTGGYVEVQVFPDSSLYKDGEEFDALKNGSVQMIAPATSKMSALSPAWQILDLPYAFKNLANVHSLMNGPIGEKLFTQLEHQGMLGLAMWDNGFKQITNSERPLIQPQDFKGLSFRVMPSKVLEQQFELLGATAYPMPFSDVHQALAVGSVDGEENTISNIYTQRFDQVQKYLTISNHGYIGYVVLVNSEFWNKLPDEVRKILEDTLAEVTAWQQQRAEEVNNNHLEELKKQGQIQIHFLSPEEEKSWRQELLPVYDHLIEEAGSDWTDIIRGLKEKGL